MRKGATQENRHKIIRYLITIYVSVARTVYRTSPCIQNNPELI